MSTATSTVTVVAVKWLRYMDYVGCSSHTRTKKNRAQPGEGRGGSMYASSNTPLFGNPRGDSFLERYKRRHTKQELLPSGQSSIMHTCFLYADGGRYLYTIHWYNILFILGETDHVLLGQRNIGGPTQKKRKKQNNKTKKTKFAHRTTRGKYTQSRASHRAGGVCVVRPTQGDEVLVQLDEKRHRGC